MPGCFNFAAARDRSLRQSFASHGLRSATTDLGDGTVVHLWLPRNPSESKPNLVLLHGLGASATWQWNDVIVFSSLSRRFNLFVPDLLFFGGSRTTRPDRSDAFQARCVAAALESHGLRRCHVAGLSYGGFVAFSLAAQFPEMVERVVICCAGVCMDGGDDDDVAVEEAVALLLPTTAKELRRLIRVSFHRPIRGVPSCFLRDFIKFMCTEYRQERKELIQALHKDRDSSKLPKITQPTLIIWGEYDAIFPIELAHRLKRHIDGNSELVIIKNAGHAINAEKPKELSNHIKSFLISQINGYQSKKD